LKIALVTDTYFPRINGVGASTQTFAREFAALGHEVHIYAPAFPGHVDEPLPYQIHRFPSWYLFFDPEDRLPRPNADKKLIQQFLDQKFDIVHTQTPFSLGQAAIPWARKSGAKVAHTYHTHFAAYVEHYLWFIPTKPMLWYTKHLSKKYCDSCDLIITPSSEMRKVLLSYDVSKPVEVIPTGILLSKFDGADPKKFREKYGFKPEDKILMFMGRVAEEKNIDFLLDVHQELLREVPNLKFVIAGAGPAKARLEKKVLDQKLNDSVLFPGYLVGEEWRNCYAGVDLFIFASVTETQGLVISEAMAAGTPVVAVGEMGVKDVMASGKGGIMTRMDKNEFTDAVRRMLTDEAFYKAKKAEARSEAENWSSTSMAKKMLAAYERTLQS
jgi:glycosyltransferase involved in cell wall biosynthesis